MPEINPPMALQIVPLFSSEMKQTKPDIIIENKVLPSMAINFRKYFIRNTNIKILYTNYLVCNNFITIIIN